MRVRSAVRRMCRDCYVVKKKRVVYIRCKSVKKHKQRQGFHTAAAAWDGQGSYAHGFGSCACCTADATTGLSAGDLWRTTAHPAHSTGVLATLPWLPAWASVPAAATAAASKEEVPPGLVASPLGKLGGWLGSSIFGRSGMSGP